MDKATRKVLATGVVTTTGAAVELYLLSAGLVPAGSDVRRTDPVIGVRVALGGSFGGQAFADTPKGRADAVARFSEMTGLYFPHDFPSSVYPNQPESAS